MYHRYTPNGNGSFHHEAIPTPPEPPIPPVLADAPLPAAPAKLGVDDLLILLILLLLMADGDEDAASIILTIAIFLFLQ